MTEAPLRSPSAAGRRRAAREREFRRPPILAMVQAGGSYAAVSRDRVRQIAASAFAAGESETKLVHARAQIARFEPALRLAARGRRPSATARPRPSCGAGGGAAKRRRAKPSRQSPRPPLTRRTALISLMIPPRRQAPGLTSLDET